MNPVGKVRIKWSPEFAYAIGLLVTDGNLSPNHRHISLVSKDIEQLRNFAQCLSLKNRIGLHSSGSGRVHFKIQFGDVIFYQYLLNLGLSPNKSKTMGPLAIPRSFFFDFMRGHFDGDGSFYSYMDPRWKTSLMCYISLNSASSAHIQWLRSEISTSMGIVGHVVKAKNNTVYQLRYAKRESLIFLRNIYYNRSVVCLSRKRDKIQKVLKDIGRMAKDARVAKLGDALP